MKILISIFLSLLLVFACKQDEPIQPDVPIIKGLNVDTTQRMDLISFGSCNRHDEPQRLWKSIADENPDLWIWMGDIIYGDSKNMNVLSGKYMAQKSHPAYQRFLEQVPIVGIWDDHDYGVNNGGKEYESKSGSRDLLFDFLDVPKENPAWFREGGYQSYTIGPEAEQVKIFLLDCRYFRDAPKRDDNGYVAATGDILGEAQWKWFEKELMSSTAKLNIIVNGIQIIPEDHKYEKWSNFPLSRDRLFNLINSSKSNCILLSGDRHIAEISKIELNSGKEIYEITSSGMTHSWDSFPGEENSHRVGEVITNLNYATLSIDWESSPINVIGEIKTEGGKSEQQLEFNLSD